MVFDGRKWVAVNSKFKDSRVSQEINRDDGKECSGSETGPEALDQKYGSAPGTLKHNLLSNFRANASCGMYGRMNLTYIQLCSPNVVSFEAKNHLDCFFSSSNNMDSPIV